VAGKKVVELRRLGKRICVGLEEDLWLVLHLMIAGRLHWKDSTTGAKKPAAKSTAARTLGSKTHLAAFEFSNGTLVLTEAGSQKRASLHVVEGEAGLRSLDPGGLEIFDPRQKPDREGGLNHTTTSLKRFAAALQSANHTLKRALTDPRLLSGIGNAYSDEILFAARLSPIKLTQRLTTEELERLYEATRATLLLGWHVCARKRDRAFPKKLRPSAKAWPCTVVTNNRVRGVVQRFSAFAMQQTKPTMPHLPDWWKATCRPRTLAAVARRLAENRRGARLSVSLQFRLDSGLVRDEREAQVPCLNGSGFRVPAGRRFRFPQT